MSTRFVPKANELKPFASVLEKRCGELSASDQGIAALLCGGGCDGAEEWRILAGHFSDLLQIEDSYHRRRPRTARIPDLFPSLANDDHTTTTTPLYLTALKAYLQFTSTASKTASVMGTASYDEALLHSVALSLKGKELTVGGNVSEGVRGVVEMLCGRVVEGGGDVVVGERSLEVWGEALSRLDRKCRVVSVVNTAESFAANSFIRTSFPDLSTPQLLTLWQTLCDSGFLLALFHHWGTPSSHDLWHIANTQIASNFHNESLEIHPKLVHPLFFELSSTHREWCAIEDFVERKKRGNIEWMNCSDVEANVRDPQRFYDFAKMGRTARLSALQHTLKRKRETTQVDIVICPLYAMWYTPGEIHHIEASDSSFPDLDIVAEWEWYIETRDWMVSLHRRHPHRYISFVYAKRVIPGADTSLLQIWRFLTKWGLINYRLSPTGRSDEVIPESSTQNSPKKEVSFSVHDDAVLAAQAEKTWNADGFAHSLPSLKETENLEGTARECMERYLSLGLTQYVDVGDGDAGGGEHVALQERVVGFLAECAPPGVAEAALGAATDRSVGSLAAAALGACQAKAALLSAQESLQLNLSLKRLVHLQIAKLRILSSALQDGQDCASHCIDSLESKHLLLKRTMLARQARIDLYRPEVEEGS